jgi:hypothetical protein
MGRVARYKKVKKSLSKATPNGADRISINNNGKDSKGSIDYFDRVGVWGLGDSGRKPKKRSLASMKLRAQRNKHLPDSKDLYDVAITEGDDFDLNDLIGSLKKEKQPLDDTPLASATKISEEVAKSNVPLYEANVEAEASVVPVIRDAVALPEKSISLFPTTESTTIAMEDERLHKKFEPQVNPKISTIVKSDGRMVGESKNAYSKRVKQETRQIIQRSNQQAHNPEKRIKKKEFLTMKKKGGKHKRTNPYTNDDETDHDEYDDRNTSTSGANTFLTGEQAVAARERATRVQFGEQAERPPNFTQLPRGAIPKNTERKKQKVIMDGRNHIVEAEQQQAMELIRRKVQAQYADIKARRRNDGDFHL